MTSFLKSFQLEASSDYWCPAMARILRTWLHLRVLEFWCYRDAVTIDSVQSGLGKRLRARKVSGQWSAYSLQEVQGQPALPMGEPWSEPAVIVYLFPRKWEIRIIQVPFFEWFWFYSWKVRTKVRIHQRLRSEWWGMEFKFKGKAEKANNGVE
jgi:hypothetical protein